MPWLDTEFDLAAIPDWNVGVCLITDEGGLPMVDKNESENTEQGAPTDAAHQGSGDGSLTGSIPAGLTAEELLERAKQGERDDAGSE